MIPQYEIVLARSQDLPLIGAIELAAAQLLRGLAPEIIEPNAAHLDEIDVHPDHGRRGLGTRLVKAVCAWAQARGNRSVTLATFREVPWNMPFYARLGFEQIPMGTLSPTLRSVVDDEACRGLDPERRVVMRWRPQSAPNAADHAH